MFSAVFVARDESTGCEVEVELEVAESRSANQQSMFEYDGEDLGESSPPN